MINSKFDFKGKRILIAEDDADLRASIKAVLELKGAEVVSSENGSVAQNLLEQETHFDLLLSDIRMPELDGIQLLKISKKIRPALKVLIFTGFSEYLETKSASELGADGFLAKPFKLTEILTLISDLLTQEISSHQAQTLSEQDFCRISVDEFYSTTKLASDIYVQLNQTKFIKLAKEGTEIDISRLQQFKDHKVAYLFVRTEDFHKYTGLNLRLASALQNSDKVSDEKKLRLYKHTSEMLLQQVFVANVEKSVCDSAFTMVSNTIRTVSGNDDLFDMLLSMNGRSDDLYAHSLQVSVLSCMIATKLGWTTPANQQKIALAGIFHDLGFKELPIELRTKPRFKMTTEDIKLYESHPIRGRDILSSIEGYPVDLVSIVAQHHEAPNGTGYPAGLTALKFHPLSKLVHVADEFSEKTSAHEKLSVELMSEILNNFFELRRDEFDRDILAAVFDLFKINRPMGLKNKAA